MRKGGEGREGGRRRITFLGGAFSFLLPRFVMLSSIWSIAMKFTAVAAACDTKSGFGGVWMRGCVASCEGEVVADAEGVGYAEELREDGCELCGFCSCGCSSGASGLTYFMKISSSKSTTVGFLTQIRRREEGKREEEKRGGERRKREE